MKGQQRENLGSERAAHGIKSFAQILPISELHRGPDFGTSACVPELFGAMHGQCTQPCGTPPMFSWMQPFSTSNVLDTSAKPAL